MQGNPSILFKVLSNSFDVVCLNEYSLSLRCSWRGANESTVSLEGTAAKIDLNWRPSNKIRTPGGQIRFFERDVCVSH